MTSAAPTTDTTTPYVAGSDTSQEAAESVSEHLERLEAAVLNLLNISLVGMTDDELEVATKLSHQCVSARRRSLVLKGKVCDSGRRRKTRSGRSAVVWVIGKDDGVVLGTSPRTNGKPSSEARRFALLEAACVCAARANSHTNLLDKAEAMACEKAIRQLLET